MPELYPVRDADGCRADAVLPPARSRRKRTGAARANARNDARTADELIVILKSGAAPFTVEVRGADASAERRAFHVTAHDASSSAAPARAYALPACTQSAYRDFFEALARDFGTRAPEGRRAIDTRCRLELAPLLTENVSPDIVYGYGDPAALRVASGDGFVYYVAVTSNDAPVGCPIVRSRDLRTWDVASCLFPPGMKPAWAAPIGAGGEYWAPELHAIGGRIVACFAAREPGGSMAIGLATAPSALGPFDALPEPVVRGGAIDPNVFVDDDGTVILLWKQDDNDVWPGLLCEALRDDPALAGELFDEPADARTAHFTSVLSPWTATLAPMERFFVQQVLIDAVVSRYAAVRAALARAHATATDSRRRARLSAILDAMETKIFAQALDVQTGTLLGERHVVLANDRTWEGHLVEGPWLTKRGGRYYLLYSGNDFTTSAYGVGVAVADRAFGPYAKADAPFVQSTPEWWGPGHPSITDAPDGTPVMFLHGYAPGRAGYKEFRALLALPLRFTPDGIEPA